MATKTNKEHQKSSLITTNEIVILGLMTALLFGFQVALAPLPNIELVSLLIIIYTIYFKYKTLLIIYAFVLLQGAFYGFHIWWINYLYIWTILFFIARIFHKEKSPLLWAIISGLYGISFGALCAIPYFFIAGPKGALAYWISGIPFDIAHCIGNFIIAFVLFAPLNHLFNRLINLIKKGNP